MMSNLCSDNKAFKNVNPWLSIVIPIYNAEMFLEKCLISIERQSDRNFEVLLIDDGSTDASAAICHRYCEKDSRFRYINKPNGGSYQTRVFGAERSKGTYVTFCDADDYYATRDAFQILHNYLSGEKYDAVQFGYEKKYNHLKKKKPCVHTVVSYDREGFLANEYPKLLCSYWDDSKINTSSCNKVYHRRLLSNFPPSDTAQRIFWGDDQIMNLQLFSTCGSFLCIPEILYVYRQSSGGTSRFSARALEDVNNIKKYQLYYLERYNGKETEKIRSVLFSEATVWFFVQIKQSLEHMSDSEIEKMIIHSLSLPSFVLAREYYLKENDCNWEAMELLRKADPKAYIEKAKASSNQNTRKDALKKILMKIYASI